jgi:TRAP-type C4-dicarboxylate transport system permease small subunit
MADMSAALLRCIALTQESFMEAFLNAIKRISQVLLAIAGTSLTFLILLTLVDVFLRSYGEPVPGTYELVALAGAVVIGFSLPSTSWHRQHVYIDFFIEKLGSRVKHVFDIVTRTMGIAFFFLLGWNLIKYGIDLGRSGEVTLTLQISFYPIAYGVGACCFIQCLVLICDLIKIAGGRYE